MKKLLNGIVDFRKNVRPAVKDTFALLALGQRPDTLFIACSDSRVVPNLFASTEPGDLFVIRNVGNLIPPFSEGESGPHFGSEAAAIQFALTQLPITEIVVCGHSECGAIKGAIDNVQLGNLTATLANIRPAVEATTGVPGERGSKNHALVQAVAETNARLAARTLLERSPVMSGLVDAGSLKVVAAMHDTGTGKVTLLG